MCFTVITLQNLLTYYCIRIYFPHRISLTVSLTLIIFISGLGTASILLILSKTGCVNLETAFSRSKVCLSGLSCNSAFAVQNHKYFFFVIHNLLTVAADLFQSYFPWVKDTQLVQILFTLIAGEFFCLYLVLICCFLI